ncbi:AI-2E family transporter [uncultured Corynebacterium sp.]|uniref:AI-2E family transporter n=1 Tax=uncultured Corynebacterium sp. TaxID=159447 RepID=UPI0025ED8B3D|nr:AI-2E family transporter [uncultured Corynebacterium sp.]
MIDEVIGAEPMRVDETLSVPDDEHQQSAVAPPLQEDGEELGELMQESEGEFVDRADVIGEGARWFAGWCLRFLIVCAAAYVAWLALGKVWAGLLPVLLALIVATVLGPPAAWLIRRKFPDALAALLSILGALAVVSGVIALIAPTVRSQLPTLRDQFTEGIVQLQEILQGPPFNVEDEQLLDLMDQATTWLQERSGDIANTVIQGIGIVGTATVTLVVMLVLTFFFIKDGRHFLPWLRSITGRRLGWHLTEVLTRSWNTLGGFIRTQAIVSFIDAVFIGLGLWLLDVPLALVLAVITFFAGFIPIVGAFTAGFIAVVVALVANGFTTALLALALIVLVQQIEGNILSPMLQSRAMNLHAAIVLLSVTLGGTLFGITGAFLAVPVAAMIAVWARYLGDLTDLRTGDKTAADIKFATEAGSISGLQTEAAGRAMRDRLMALRLGGSKNSSDDDPSTDDAHDLAPNPGFGDKNQAADPNSTGATASPASDRKLVTEDGKRGVTTTAFNRISDAVSGRFRKR